MKKIFINFCTLFSILFILTIPALVVAAGPSGGGTTGGASGGGVTPITATIENPFKFGPNSTLMDFFVEILQNIIIPIGGILAVLAFIYSGFLYVTAQGNESKISTAHTALLYTAIGTAVLLGSSAAAKIIKNTIDQLQ